MEGKQESSTMGMVVLAEYLNVKDTQRCSLRNNMLSSRNGVFVNGVGFGMVSTWVPLVQIETDSIGDDSGGSRSNNDTKGGGFTFWTTNRAKIRWGRIDQASRYEVGGRWRSNTSTPEARKQDMLPHFFKISLGYELTHFPSPCVELRSLQYQCHES
eukprot:scaffold94169_cov62-Attheya_sp.AAC.1